MNKKYQHQITTYYDESLRDYEIVWQLKDSMALHYGYWDEDTNTHRQALWNMNYHVAKHAQITNQDLVLDAGCGVGGTSFFLANNIGCSVHGISLAEAHIERALQYKTTNDPNDLVTFSVQNFCHTSFPDNTFDVILGIESIVHAENASDFFTEAFRILKPGGRLLISDYFTRPTQNKIEVETLKKWGDSWAIHKFIIEKNFCEAAENIGFKSVLLKDITKNVFPSIKIMHRSYYPGIFISRISNFFGNRTNVQVINSKSGKFQYQSFKQGVWRYKHFLAFKEAAQPYSSIDDYLKTPKPCNVYTDKEKFKERFPIISIKGISTRNTLKRIMHFYLETGIKNDKKWF